MVQGEVTYTTIAPAIASHPPVSIPSESAVSASPVVSPKPESPESPISPVSQQKWLEITAPMVGTFYRAPSPDDPAYVNVNDVIRTGQVVCIVEAMKLMNEIESEISGKVMEILVENGEPVEYGQTLMWVNPD
jgi:acetyl-CoA carboxylase biotin carboxyl carrier protein